MLVVENISIMRDGNCIINNVSLCCKPGEIHLLLGKNGAGKSTIALALMGHPAYTTFGNAYLNGIDLLKLPAHERSKQGLFLSFQHPQEIPGVQVSTFLYEACRAHDQLYNTIDDFLTHVRPYMKLLNLDESLLYRELNHGFSGGEKKRFELLQLLLLQPKVTILDEPDSGLDFDALKCLKDAIILIKKQLPETILIIITHYQHLFTDITPDAVHIVDNGGISRSGDYTLADTIFSQGYANE